MGLQDDIRKVTNTFDTGKGMEGFETWRGDLAKDPAAYRNAVEDGSKGIGNVDKMGDNELYDMYGRMEMGTNYNPKAHRKIFQVSDVKPYEIKQGIKMSHSNTAGNSRYGSDGANLRFKFQRDARPMHLPRSGKLHKREKILMPPPEGRSYT